MGARAETRDLPTAARNCRMRLGFAAESLGASRRRRTGPPCGVPCGGVPTTPAPHWRNGAISAMMKWEAEGEVELAMSRVKDTEGDTEGDTWPPRLDRPADPEAMFRAEEDERHPLIPTTAVIVL